MVASFPVAALAVLFQCTPLAYSFSGAFSSYGRIRVQSWKAPSSTLHASPRSSPLSRAGLAILSASNDNDSTGSSGVDGDDGSIDVDTDPRLRRIRLSRALGIDWGTDLSFSFVYVRDLEPSGAASISGAVEIGDQICELRPVVENGEAINLIGAPFDEVMGSFASLGRDVRDVDLVFFRGTKEELKAACAGGSLSEEDEKITITVVQNKGAKDEAIRQIEAKAGCNVRQILTDNGINVYQSVTRWTNCKGKQLCGTCIVNVADGEGSTNRKSLDEASTLRENPESYRLSCVTFAYGDVTVETFPPVEASQWTR
ncbi:hypothetical protein ACHAXR_003087 [Thalassiosira sp. AJA248-18]